MYYLLKPFPDPISNLKHTTKQSGNLGFRKHLSPLVVFAGSPRVRRRGLRASCHGNVDSVRIHNRCFSTVKPETALFRLRNINVSSCPRARFSKCGTTPCSPCVERFQAINTATKRLRQCSSRLFEQLFDLFSVGFVFLRNSSSCFKL